MKRYLDDAFFVQLVLTIHVPENQPKYISDLQLHKDWHQDELMSSSLM